jgi:hypothetical protein
VGIWVDDICLVIFLDSPETEAFMISVGQEGQTGFEVSILAGEWEY